MGASAGGLEALVSIAGGLPSDLDAADGEVIRSARHASVAPARRHAPEHGPKVNGFLPALDPLFRSAADSFEDDAIGVVLSGGLSDGAAGLRAVQDPEEAPFPSMPNSALEMGPVDYTLRPST
jgi:two-component system chemotaxis response regulator CheB